MAGKGESGHKLHARMRLWEFPDEYVVEPTDGTGGSFLSVSRVDGSMKLLGLPFHSLFKIIFLNIIRLLALTVLLFNFSSYYFSR